MFRRAYNPSRRNAAQRKPAVKANPILIHPSHSLLNLSLMKPIAFFLLGCSASLAAQWLNYPDAHTPRTKDGKPNLTASLSASTESPTSPVCGRPPTPRLAKTNGYSAESSKPVSYTHLTLPT